MATRRNAPQEETSAIVPEVIQSATSFDENALREITTFDEAILLTQQTLGHEIDIASKELGDGFSLLTEKTSLIGVPLFFMEWTFREGDFGLFVSVRGMTESGKKFIVNDGSTGIAAQLMAHSERTGRQGGMLIAKGLRVSEYPTDETGQPLDRKTAKEHPELVKGKGSTYYLDTSG